MRSGVTPCFVDEISPQSWHRQEMTRLVTSVDHTLSDPQFSHGAGDTMRGVFTSSTSRGVALSCSSVGMVCIAALPALMGESTSGGLSLESASILLRKRHSTAAVHDLDGNDGLGTHALVLKPARTSGEHLYARPITLESLAQPVKIEAGDFDLGFINASGVDIRRSTQWRVSGALDGDGLDPELTRIRTPAPQ
jgi:hypothetical protein